MKGRITISGRCDSDSIGKTLYQHTCLDSRIFFQFLIPLLSIVCDFYITTQYFLLTIYSEIMYRFSTSGYA